MHVYCLSEIRLFVRMNHPGTLCASHTTLTENTLFLHSTVFASLLSGWAAATDRLPGLDAASVK